MDVKMYLAITSVIAALYGIAFLVIPGPLDALFGVTPDAATIFTDRLLGTELLTLGLVVWFVRATSDRTATRGVLMGVAVGNVVGAFVTIWGTVTGIVNALGWSSVLIYVVLLAGCVYYLFADDAAAGRI
jgi:hypothetical protein